MARIEVNTVAENQNLMFDEMRKILGGELTSDPRSALNMLLFPISLLARTKDEKIQIMADKMEVWKCEGIEIDDLLNNFAFPRKNPNYSIVNLLIRGGVGVQLSAGDLIVEAKDGTQYTLIEDGILNNEGRYKFECNVWGNIGNKEAGEIIKFTKIKAGIYELLQDIPATGGQEEETDNEYLKRWTLSRKQGSWNLDAIYSSILKLNGVKSVFADENDENIEVRGIPPKSIIVVIEGGAEDEIAQTLWDVKEPAIKSVGDITKEVKDIQGNIREVSFYRPSKININYKIEFTPIASMNITENDLKILVEEYINNINLSGYLTSYDCENKYIRSIYDNTKLLNIDVYFKRETETEYSKVLKLNFNEVGNAISE